MTIKLDDLFYYKIREMYYIEKELVDQLAVLATSSKDPDLKNAFRDHKEETIVHATRLEEVFTLLGRTPVENLSPTLQGMEKEHSQFFRKGLSADVADFFNLTAAIKAERIEISAYEALILLAKEIDIPHKDTIIDLLGKNKDEEERALDKALTSLKAQIPLWKRIVH